ncbi:MAG: TadE/TadG family type IV pilus assembly protein [Oscillochloridaceae bacterium umkhey_bin13]
MERQPRKSGQSIVEMGLMLPILLVVLFGIIEFGWLIFAYSSIAQATRNAAEVAAQLPPFPEWLSTDGMTDEALAARYGATYMRQYPYPGFRNDRCIDAILTAIEDDVTIFGGPGDTDRMINYVRISYPNGPNTRNLDVRGPIEIEIAYPVRSLTPVFDLLGIGGEDGIITMRVVQRRSIENLGRDPTSKTNVACAQEPKDYYDINDITP